jgi:hypothetical protein
MYDNAMTYDIHININTGNNIYFILTCWLNVTRYNHMQKA